MLGEFLRLVTQQSERCNMQIRKGKSLSGVPVWMNIYVSISILILIKKYSNIRSNIKLCL
jgi:hypothetical protein